MTTKPHGHGDVHMLLHMSGLAKKWLEEGRKYVTFFQDTNPLMFHTLPASLGVSEALDFDMNSLCVPRSAGEAIGAIAKLDHPEKDSITCNVEYNQLGPLLSSTGDKKGDVAGESGFSIYPGNINQLVLKLSSYVEVLDASNGVVCEFVNPKYANAEKTKFTSPTRVECMMQA